MAVGARPGRWPHPGRGHRGRRSCPRRCRRPRGSALRRRRAPGRRHHRHARAAVHPCRLGRLRRRRPPAGLADRRRLHARPHLAADDPPGVAEEATALPAPRHGVRCAPSSSTGTGCRWRRTSRTSTGSSRSPSRTTSAPTARASPSSSCGCARTPATAGTTGGSRRSRPTRACCPPGHSSRRCCAGPGRHRGQLRGLHRRAPARPRTWCRQGVVAHRHPGCRAPRPQPRGPRGGCRLAHRRRRPLRRDGLGHRPPHPSWHREIDLR